MTATCLSESIESTLENSPITTNVNVFWVAVANFNSMLKVPLWGSWIVSA